MKIPGPSALLSTIGVALLVSACSSGSSSDSNGAMFVQTCSLGCGSGASGAPVDCAFSVIAVNQEIWIIFSQEVDPSSVDPTSFQIIDDSGNVPIGTRLVDAADHHKVIFRPSVTFDSLGNASFGFAPTNTYHINVPGTGQSSGSSFIRSTDGRPNISQMACSIQTTQGVVDPVPGPPVVSVKVDKAITATPDPNDFIPNVDAPGAVDVWRFTTIRFIFLDVMNPVTLVNPVTHQPAFASVQVDVDGNLGTTTDRVTLSGNWTAEIDLSLLQTVMVCTPTNGIPSGSALQDPHRKIVVNLPSSIQDLAGNHLANSGTIFFTPEIILYPPTPLPDADGENFQNGDNEDVPSSSAVWGDTTDSTTFYLTRGYGGGSGRLGDLFVPTGLPVVLDTDGTVFKNLSSPLPVLAVATNGLLDNSFQLPTAGGYDPTDPTTYPTITVNDGIFEFSSLNVDAGGTLKIKGSSHARVFSRGPVIISGTIDVSGETPPPFQSDTAQGQPGGLGGPLAGKGGKGADRPDNSGNPTLTDTTPGHLIAPAGISNPGAVTDGTIGDGVGSSSNIAAGKGGEHFPTSFPTTWDTNPPFQGTMTFSNVSDSCLVRQIASPGGGGAYATDGLSAIPNTPVPIDTHLTSNLPTNAALGGFTSDVGLEAPDPQSLHVKRKLEAVLGVPGTNLNGGSGGGGAGAHLYDTNSDGFGSISCEGGHLITYWDHSGCGGGGGGGALQLVSGGVMQLAGVIDARGGDGGSNLNVVGNGRVSRAVPGGGGSGGAVRLQAKILDISALTPGRIDVSGGDGGTNFSPNVGLPPTISLGAGGGGGAGLVRLEDVSGGAAPPPATLMLRCSEAPKILPFDPLHLDPNTPVSDPCFNSPESEMSLSVGPWARARKRPECFTGATSCWMKAPGSFFTVEFKEDDFSVPGSPVYGWNMDVVYNSGGGQHLLKYRAETPSADPNYPNLGGMDFEEFIGSNMNYLGVDGTGNVDTSSAGSYFAVRFQGALATTDISTDPCGVVLSGGGSQIAPGTLTPWVRSPQDLNAFFPKPNMVRFCVVFDLSKALSPGSVEFFIRGVTNLVILAQPD